MAIFNFSKHVQELSDNIKAYIASNIEYYRLVALKKAVKAVSILVQAVVVGSLFLFFLTLISIGLSLYIGKQVGEISYGFLIVGGFYFLLFLLFFIFRKTLITKFVLKQFSKVATDEESVKETLDEPLENKFERTEKKEQE